MSESHVLTIDLGTSGPKAAVVSSGGSVVGSARASVRTEFIAGGGAEQDPEAVWNATLDSARAAIADSRLDPSAIVAIAASSQYSSVVPVGRDGSPVANMVVWMDQRGAPKRLKKLSGYPRFADRPDQLLRWLQIHGLPPIEGGMSLTHMRWIRYGRPDVYERTAYFLEPVDYLTMRFTGRATANQCSAYMMLLTDNRQLGTAHWDPQLVSQSLIDADKLPEMVPVGAIVGDLLPDVARQLGLAATTPVLSGINDTQAGAVAAGACAGSHAGLSLGTTSVMITHVDKKKTDPFNTLFTMPSPVGNQYLMSAENGTAGVAVDYFLDNVIYPDDSFVTPATVQDRYEAFNDAASGAAVGSGGVIFMPWLKGSLAPQADSKMRGGFVNVGLDTTRDQLARAVLEGVAMNLRWMRAPVEKFISRPISHFVFYGGGAHSQLWAQIMADVLGTPIHRLAEPGFANSLGTAMFAFDKLGRGAAAASAATAPIEQIVEPDPASQERYEELSGAFVDLFKKTRPILRGLNKRR